MNRLLIFGLAFLVAGVGSARAASENPFGFETEKHPLEYEYCKKDHDPKHGPLRNHGYICSSAPRPHPDFHEYFIQFVEEVGLCRIVALSFQVGNNSATLEGVKDQIAEKYGLPTYRPGPVDAQPYEWVSKDGFPGVGDVTRIHVSMLRDQIRVWFEIRPLSQCERVLNEKAKRAF